jgi:two-component system, NtrC family, nitrogen regulation sensor histidine kinase NtrY
LVVRASVRAGTWQRLTKLRRQRRIQNVATISLFVLGPVLAFLTFLILGPLEESATSPKLRLILLADLVYVLVIAALVLQRVAQMIAARRAKSAGSRLHLRLTGVFALLALIPTVLVAVFAVLTVNVGLEGWFSSRVRQVVGNSLSAAQAYEAEHRHDLIQDAQALARFLEAQRKANVFISDGDIRQLLTRGQAQVQRGLREAFVIDGTGKIRSRGERSYLFDYEQPKPAEIARARDGETVVIQDWGINEFRALVALTGFADRYLYVTRNVDGGILSLLDDTQETVRLYNQLESERGKLLFEFGLLYLGFAVILILAAIWLGMWFAERLSRPVGRLAGAAQRVGGGDLDVQVVEEDGDDEIAMLGRLFNQMTRQLKGQRDTLLKNNRQIEERRRLFDSVLSSVTSGVAGLDNTGRVTFMNRSAEGLLGLHSAPDERAPLSLVAPEFGALFARLKASGDEVVQDEIRLTRAGKQENLLVRMSIMRNAEGQLQGYVVAFDDVTDLVAAQRMAAWGDVARRIAHEIKNPLTPIQLSAERLKRKFAPMLGDAAPDLTQYADVIIRQTNDLRRIVDEFSRFARMPEPDRREHDLVALVADAVHLQEHGQPEVSIVADLPAAPVIADLDATMISQALTNMIKNAGEAIETRKEKGISLPFEPEIRVTMQADERRALITISDNGIGLPADRARLFEPYVTTRAAGTGLGLPIVKKIIEEHGGTLVLTDADCFGSEPGHCGARAEIRLPLGRAPAPRVRHKHREIVK